VITINASSAATIVLRHLSLNGNNSASAGINTQLFATLVVEDCAIQGFTSGANSGAGIGFSTTAGRGLLQVSDSRIFNNAFGINIQADNSEIISVTLNRIELTGNLNDGLRLGSDGVIAGTMRGKSSAETHKSAYLRGQARSFSRWRNPASSLI
jgi:hypothetical protein